MFKTAEFKTLTDAAASICPQLAIHPDQLMQKTLDKFVKNHNEPEQLTRIRFDHYQNKRKRTLRSFNFI